MSVANFPNLPRTTGSRTFQLRTGGVGLAGRRCHSHLPYLREANPGVGLLRLLIGCPLGADPRNSNIETVLRLT